MTTKKDDDKKDPSTPIGRVMLKRIALNALDERAQVKALVLECFPGAIHERPITQMACQHSLILRHAHEISVRGSESQRRKAIVALSGIVFDIDSTEEL